MRVKGFRALSILAFALVLHAEIEQFSSSLVVELQHLAVGPEGVQDIFHRVKVKVYAGDDLVLLLEGV